MERIKMDRENAPIRIPEQKKTNPEPGSLRVPRPKRKE
jgi:hypothetical protein